MAVSIRAETPDDHARVENVIEAAFRDVPFSDHQEQRLVARLRRSEAFVPGLSLVAEVDGHLVGHILLTKVTIRQGNRTFPSLALAPVSMHPGYQRTGVGAALIRTAHQKARELGFTSVILLGHEGYYPRLATSAPVTTALRFPSGLPKLTVWSLLLPNTVCRE